MAERAGKAPLTKPHMVGRQILRNTPEDYWRRVVFFTFYRQLKKTAQR